MSLVLAAVVALQATPPAGENPKKGWGVVTVKQGHVRVLLPGKKLVEEPPADAPIGNLTWMEYDIFHMLTANEAKGQAGYGVIVFEGGKVEKAALQQDPDAPLQAWLAWSRESMGKTGGELHEDTVTRDGKKGFRMQVKANGREKGNRQKMKADMIYELFALPDKGKFVALSCGWAMQKPKPDMNCARFLGSVKFLDKN